MTFPRWRRARARPRPTATGAVTAASSPHGPATGPTGPSGAGVPWWAHPARYGPLPAAHGPVPPVVMSVPIAPIVPLWPAGGASCGPARGYALYLPDGPSAIPYQDAGAAVGTEGRWVDWAAVALAVYAMLP